MIIYGRNPVREALRGRRAVRRTWATPRTAREPWLRGVTLERAGAEQLRGLCGSDEHQGVCAEVEEFSYADADEVLRPEDALVVCLDGVQDPHNLGAVCRVAEAAGASGLVIPERRSAAVTPAVCKASAGAVEHLRVARVRNLADWLTAARERLGLWAYGADPTAAVPYLRPDYRGRVALVLGSEGKGLRPRVAASCDELVALPLRGRLASLNVATAAGALLYGMLHRREAALDRAP